MLAATGWRSAVLGLLHWLPVAGPGLSGWRSGWWLLLAVAALAGSAGVALWLLLVRMPGRSFAGPLDPLSGEQERLRQALQRHVHVLAERIGERHAGAHNALERTAGYLESTLADFGYAVASHAYRVGSRTYRNLEARIPGAVAADELVIVGAHYDTVAGAPGADDNASGVAAVLELARAFQSARLPRTLALVFFTNEEPPWFNTKWMGSRVYAQQASRRGDRIVAMLALESIGYYSDEPASQRYPPPLGAFYGHRGDFIGFVANLASRALVRRAVGTFRGHARFPSAGVAAPAMLPGVAWSDQASFWHHGYPAVMITDTAPFRNPHYHTSGDTVETLDFDRLARVVDGLTLVVTDLVGLESGTSR